MEASDTEPVAADNAPPPAGRSIMSSSNPLLLRSSSSSEMPYFCPRCGDKLRFSSVPELRVHLVSRHTYETLLMLSQTRVRSSRAALLPGPAASQPGSSSPGPAVCGPPLPPTCLDLVSSSASLQLLRGVLGGPAHASPPEGQPLCGVLALPGPALGLEARLGLERRLAHVFAEVEERVNRRVSRLRVELQRREAELELQRRDGERLRSEKQEVEERAVYLSRQVSVAVEMMEQLRAELRGKESQLSQRQQEMLAIDRFLRETAEKEAEAKSRLQVFIETLLERADHAEQQLLLFSSHHHRHGQPHADPYTANRRGRSLDGSSDDIISQKLQGTIGNRRSYSMSGSCLLGEQLRSLHPYSMVTARTRTSSLGSGGWANEGLGLLAPPLSRCDGGGSICGGGRGQTWSRRRQHSTEEEEEEEDEEEEEEEDEGEEGLWRRLHLSRTNTPGSDPASSLSSASPRLLGADALRLRAGLFCVFPYLDVRSLLLAAEVCSDWRFVARHPAVWTRLRLENAKVSSEFLVTLSQWCTQTQTLVLQNLKPRRRRGGETQEEYLRNTRGSVEPGLEAVLRSAGGSLLHLSVSCCPHILTDRCVWLTSCYCRNLTSLTYRSSSDPLGHEVLWALGAGCRSISRLQVAPAHPCHKPTRFGGRCLQTIGRCWPHLRWLSVGGAGCETQGLVAVVRSCAHLQLLELERITDLGLQVASELCGAGLTRLQTLILRHTPVSGQAILHFHSVCKSLRRIMVEVSVSDYFEEPETQEAEHLFGEILGTLKVLQMRPGLCDSLQIKAEGFC